MPPEFVNTKPFPPTVRERPILFSAPMVRALLDGTKTQTRRVVKPQPWATARSAHFTPATADGEHAASVTFSAVDSYDPPWACLKPVRSPYGQPGDRLWVRETHAPQADCWGSWERWLRGAGGEAPILHYAADFKPFQNDNGFVIRKPFIEKWRPSIHMPRWASRIDLELTAVRVERLQSITAADAKAEGIEGQFENGPWRNYGRDGCWFPEGKDTAAVLSYRSLWEQINGAGSWAANPWVWVVEFQKIKQREEASR